MIRLEEEPSGELRRSRSVPSRRWSSIASPEAVGGLGLAGRVFLREGGGGGLERRLGFGFGVLGDVGVEVLGGLGV